MQISQGTHTHTHTHNHTHCTRADISGYTHTHTLYTCRYIRVHTHTHAHTLYTCRYLTHTLTHTHTEVLSATDVTHLSVYVVTVPFPLGLSNRALSNALSASIYCNGSDVD